MRAIPARTSRELAQRLAVSGVQSERYPNQLAHITADVVVNRVMHSQVKLYRVG
jgi:hypothetical protein